MKLFILSQKHLPLSIAEVEALYPDALVEVNDHIAFVKSEKKYYEQLTFTKAVHDILFFCSPKNIFSLIKKYPWGKLIKNPYCIRSPLEERKIAAEIWHSLQKPNVSLENPKTEIHFIFIGKKVYATKLLWENDNTCLQRKPHTRPGFYPASLDPQLARAMVNLSGVVSDRKGRAIVDPFCGTGGILIEAAFLRHRCYGYDYSSWMLKKCKQNIAHYDLKNVVLQQGDAKTFLKKCAAIVTDPPYGKNTKSQDIVALYHAFLENAKQSTNKMVMNFPNTVDYRKIIRSTQWRIQKEFSWYVHGSLTRMIVVLGR